MNDRSDPGPDRRIQGTRQDGRTEFVRQHYDHVFAVCYGILVNVHDAQDAAQETMLRGLVKAARRVDSERDPAMAHPGRQKFVHRPASAAETPGTAASRPRRRPSRT